MHSGFVIGAIFLAAGIALTVWVVAYKAAAIDPLAAEQLALMQSMSCEELSEYAATGYFWSVDNSAWSRDRLDACAA